MTFAALIVALISLGLAAVAYWRSGGQRDFARIEAQLRREFEPLRARQHEFAEHASQTITAGFERARKRLDSARIRVHDLQAAAIDGLEVQLRRAAEQIEALSQRLEHGASAAKDATLGAARAAEQRVSKRVRRLHARVVLLEVKAKATLAQQAAAGHYFVRADSHLLEALDLLHDARRILGDDDAYDPQLDAIKARLRHAVTAVREQAEDSRQRIDQVLADTDEVVTALETAERESSKTETDTPAASRT